MEGSTGATGTEGSRRHHLRDATWAWEARALNGGCWRYSLAFPKVFQTLTFFKRELLKGGMCATEDQGEACARCVRAYLGASVCVHTGRDQEEQPSSDEAGGEERENTAKGRHRRQAGREGEEENPHLWTPDTEAIEGYRS